MATFAVGRPGFSSDPRHCIRYHIPPVWATHECLCDACYQVFQDDERYERDLERAERARALEGAGAPGRGA